MAGLLAWAADVVGANPAGDDEEIQIPMEIAFTREQQQYALELDRKASNLRKSIQDLRLRIPPPHISQRLPHLHAHTIASNADLAMQLNAHSTTKEQVQQREITLQEENVAYEKDISNCQKKIQEKLLEADSLKAKLKELNLNEAKLEKEFMELESNLSTIQADNAGNKDLQSESKASKDAKVVDLEEKKKEMSLMEEKVRRLEEEWSVVQDESIKQPSTAQREKLLEKQLHCLVEQLTAKQAQAEGLMSEIRAKEREVERLNALRRRIDNGSSDANAAITTRNLFVRSNVPSSSSSTDCSFEASSHRHGGRTESQRRLMFLRSAFVLYIFALHLIVFVKISF